jgi:hypothetical protein
MSDIYHQICLTKQHVDYWSKWYWVLSIIFNDIRLPFPISCFKAFPCRACPPYFQENINRFNPATIVCLSQARMRIFNVIRRGLFNVQWFVVRDGLTTNSIDIIIGLTVRSYKLSFNIVSLSCISTCCLYTITTSSKFQIVNCCNVTVLF